MKRIRQSWAWALVMVSLAFLLQPLGAKAQDAPVAPDAQNADEQDPPSRVARLNYMEGSVSFQPGGENDWVTSRAQSSFGDGRQSLGGRKFAG